MNQSIRMKMNCVNWLISEIMDSVKWNRILFVFEMIHPVTQRAI